MKIAGANPGERTDWDICYDVLFQMTDGGWEVLRKDPTERSFQDQEMLTDYFIDWYYTVISNSDNPLRHFPGVNLAVQASECRDPLILRRQRCIGATELVTGVGSFKKSLSSIVERERLSSIVNELRRICEPVVCYLKALAQESFGIHSIWDQRNEVHIRCSSPKTQGVIVCFDFWIVAHK